MSEGGGRRGAGWRGEKKGGGQSEGTWSCGDPNNVPGGAGLQRAGSCITLIKYKGINELFVGAHEINISQAMDPRGGLLSPFLKNQFAFGQVFKRLQRLLQRVEPWHKSCLAPPEPSVPGAWDGPAPAPRCLAAAGAPGAVTAAVSVTPAGNGSQPQQRLSPKWIFIPPPGTQSPGKGCLRIPWV